MPEPDETQPDRSGAGRPDRSERAVGSGRTIVGRYRLDRVLGKGSMGTVWAAYDETLHRRVAIKEIYVPHGTPHSEAEMLMERTLREARAIAQLSHPNVITLYDILTLPGGPVIVMEVLAARSLGEVLKEVGPLTVGQAATVGLAVAAGLSAAHAAGITHRDVKPGNVLIGGDGRIKLTDFGIARSAAENPMTATGLLLGSPAYIAPEVASGETAGATADAWGLGALLFSCTEGKPPFDKGSPVATLMSVVNDPLPPLQRSDAMSPVIKGLLVKDPAHRLNLRQARAALRPLADDPVETRLIFASTSTTEDPGRRPGPVRPVGAPIRPDSGLVGPRQDPRQHPRRDQRPTPTGRPAAPGAWAAVPVPTPPPTARMRPSWLDDVPPRTPPSRATVAGSGTSGTSGTAGSTAYRPGGTGTAGPGLLGGVAAASALPPPPWANTGSHQLEPLPPAPAPFGSVRSPVVVPNRASRLWIVVVVFVAAALIAFFGIRAIAEQVETSAAGMGLPAQVLLTHLGVLFPGAAG